jgi:hypothetical protein
MTALQESHKHPRGELVPVAWVADRDLAYDEWLRLGWRLGVAGRNAGWWVGDWVRYGTTRYGSKYTVAARVTGYDAGTLMNMVYVANRFEISRRRENLSWSHHAELAALELDEQDRWLDRATKERLSVRDLRELLASKPPPADAGSRLGGRARALKRASSAGLTTRRASPSISNAEVGLIIVCPHCGCRFVRPS